jgi:hypothetical protein
MNRGRSEWDVLSPHERAVNLGAAGAPALGVELRLDDEGEILARSSIIMAGYWEQPEETNKAIVDGWFHTGDGGTVFAPLKMPLAMAKEYLMLARPFTAKELATMGVVNYAVPAAELDAKTDEIAQRLLKRNAYALAMTKRVLNKQAMAQFNQSHDASLAYEFLNFYMQTPQAKELGKGRGETKL